MYVGEVLVTGVVRETAFDSGDATLEPADTAEKFWKLHARCGPATVTIS